MLEVEVVMVGNWNGVPFGNFSQGGKGSNYNGNPG